MTDLDRLRLFAQEEADLHGEAALVILDPPPGPVNGFRSVIPYVVLTSVANAEERAAAVERVDPQQCIPVEW